MLAPDTHCISQSVAQINMQYIQGGKHTLLNTEYYSVIQFHFILNLNLL